MGASESKPVANKLLNVTLWKSDRSPACRAVMMALDAMGLSVNEIDVNMDKGDHRKEHMYQKNSLQTLPVLEDHKLILHDSNTICTYLGSRYYCGPLLPPDAGARALVDQQLHYNGGILYPRYRAVVDPILYENRAYILPAQATAIECGYADLEGMLAGRQYFSGSWPTLADICLASTISTLNVILPIDQARFPLLSTWLYRMSGESFYKTANMEGLGEFVRRIGG